MPNPNPTTLDEQIAESIELTRGHIGELTLGESLAIIRGTLEAARKEIERLHRIEACTRCESKKVLVTTLCRECDMEYGRAGGA